MPLGSPESLIQRLRGFLATLTPGEPKMPASEPLRASQTQFKLGPRSERRLEGVHPDLQKVIRRAIQITPIDFTVLEGLRSIQRQRYLYSTGKSKTMNSRHLTGHAVDIAPYVNGKVSWDWEDYYPLADAVKQAAKELHVPIEWGGDWRTFKDGPHWQLPWNEYPR